MLWIVQKDVRAQNQQYDLVHVLNRLGIEYIEVDVAKGRLDPEVVVAPGERVLTNGSIMLSNIARDRGWEPGSLFGENFTYNAWSKEYSEMILNKDATVCLLKDAKPLADKMFARPVLDNKTFNGRVFQREEFLEFQRKCIGGDAGFPRADTEILISAPKKIGQEHRHYIVDGKIISSSRYKLAGLANFAEGADEAVLELARAAISRWTPARAFVMDTYVSGDEVGIVEIGCICHAGIYDADLMCIVDALDSMPLEMDRSVLLYQKRHE